MIFVNYHRVWIAIVIAKCIYIITKLKFLPIFFPFCLLLSLERLLLSDFMIRDKIFQFLLDRDLLIFSASKKTIFFYFEIINR